MENYAIDNLSKYLKIIGSTVSVADSVTSGYLQFLFSQITDASTFYKSGITAYILQENVHHLSIDKVEAKKRLCIR